ncbi:probable cytochrome P450 12a5, mitochondrial [Physella acuta]|uniref:probable cytochrome P450 12a5, mitochondrial n=1 Tax=Physella acuta TaxID=109671 RepID=UPI0027DC1B39|nr:probable cytochrome P450 12a5, mitochondrial [Physella acuta]XP_059176946.1 probable cytochrome P450 12a5, mitochondrial [Physella acuta]XP_059176947.1 probable cytochrome P450 12a5, mitochondrial [Physella acuta]
MMRRYDIVSRVIPNVIKSQPIRWTSVASSANKDEVKPFEEIPGPKGLYNIPFIGSVLHFKPFGRFTPQTTHKLIDSLHDKYGPVVRVQLGGETVLLEDLKDIETVFRNEGKYPNRPGIDISKMFFERNGFKLGLSQIQGEEWHALRTPVNKRLMKADSAHHYLVPQNAVADDFVNILATQKLTSEEMKDLFFRFASESIAVVTFNTRLGFLDHSCDIESSEFLEATKRVFSIIADTLSGKEFSYKFYKSKTYLDLERSYFAIRKNARKHALKAREIIEQQQKDGTLNTEEPNLLLSLASEKGLENEDISNLLDSLYMAGTDSTAKNLQVFFYNLAKNPDKQEILRKEILEAVGESGVVDAKALSKMSYLKHCLKESFRLNYPTLTGTLRILPKDIVASGYNIPAGTRIIMCNQRAAKKCFEDPDKFIPERWMRADDGRKQDNTNSMAVIPFGHGPRNCIGRRFAVQEIYLAAAKVLQKLHIEIEPESWNTEFIYTTFIDTEKPIRFKFTKIQ